MAVAYSQEVISRLLLTLWIMRFATAISLVSSAGPILAAAQGEQTVLSDYDANNEKLYRVAIVGAGMAGASAALRLGSMSTPSAPISVTVFDKESAGGGRVKTVSVPLPTFPKTAAEAGAPYFFASDWCLALAMNHTNLSEARSGTSQYSIPTIALWDGESLADGLRCNDELPAYDLWWLRIFPYLPPPEWARFVAEKTLRVLSVYLQLIRTSGLSLWRYQVSAKSALAQWKAFGADGHRFEALEQGLSDVGLGAAVFRSASSYLSGIGIAQGFADHRAEPCAVGLFSQRLGQIRGLASLISTQHSRRVAIEGGMVRLVEGMIERSRADLLLNTKVVAITPGAERRYRIAVESESKTEDPVDVEFDSVIIAAPLAGGLFDSISSFQPYLSATTPEYVETHVTHFTSFSPLDPSFFGPQVNESVPEAIVSLTDQQNIQAIRQLPALFYLDPSCDDEDCDEIITQYLYRILSRGPVSNAELASMIGRGWHEGDSLEQHDITWLHRQAWPHALPKYDGQPLPGNIEVAPGLFYIGSADEVVSSLEMACRSGRNAADHVNLNT